MKIYHVVERTAPDWEYHYTTLSVWSTDRLANTEIDKLIAAGRSREDLNIAVYILDESYE